MKTIMVVAVFALVLSGCGAVKNWIGSSGPGGSNSINDFLKTQILVSSPAQADGISPLVFVIQLKNSNDTPVANYVPTYTIRDGSGVIVPSSCTSSDADGISVCLLKSTVPGSKTLQLTNALAGLTTTVDFSSSTTTGKAVVVSGSKAHSTTSGGFSAQWAVGSPAKGVSLTSSGGYKVTLSLQGASSL
jgi:hypothetical protein